MNRLSGIIVFFLAVICGGAQVQPVNQTSTTPAPPWATRTLRAGIFGTDTSHVPAFAEILRSHPEWKINLVAEVRIQGVLMRHRLATEVGVLAALIVWAPLAVAPVAGQTPSSAANTKGTTKTETTPRTAWGDPDLQGVWSYATLTPLERPAAVAGREFFTREEAAAREAEAAGGCASSTG